MTFKTRTQMNFGYGTLIVSFILERVPIMRPQMSLGPLDPREPRKGRWASLDPRTIGGPIHHFFREYFFEWLSGQILIINDYVYGGMDFTRDPNLILPPSTHWGP